MTVVSPLSDEPSFEMGVAQVSGDRRVTLEYNGGPICTSDHLAQEPGSIRVTYGKEITIEIDPYTRGCGDAESAEYRAAVEIELEQTIDGRRIDVIAASSPGADS